ncbi:nucleotidyl transferase AbiEii/AbiGii toxin family protein [Candidatus Daviesbacteria bacterium]|nr:nucleotidyl transferase AbiEii/AbiGii toxin family protein [Candidatus Daviesbacteria bacterium]
MTGLTDEQRSILEEIGRDEFLGAGFYFSGGTALSSVYLHHRISEDLDFFSEHTFDPLSLLNKITSWSKKLGFEISPQTVENTYIYNLTFPPPVLQITVPMRHI